MKISFILSAALLLTGCGDSPQAAPARQPEAAKPAAAPTCSPPTLNFAEAGLNTAQAKNFGENFSAALAQACDENLFADEPLIDPRSADRGTLFVINAPNANIPSIYLQPDGKPLRTLLEVPFGFPGSPPQIPSVSDLYETIYCAVHGATPEEEANDGRCLPD